MDAFQLLKHDHDEVKGLFKQIMDEHAVSTEVYSEISDELRVHMHSEEEYLYPLLENEEKVRDMVLEAYEEHAVAKELMKKLDRESLDEDHWLASIKVLNDIVEHHIEEEEKELFKKAKPILGKDQMREIADKIREEKMGLEEAA